MNSFMQSLCLVLLFIVFSSAWITPKTKSVPSITSFLCKQIIGNSPMKPFLTSIHRKVIATGAALLLASNDLGYAFAMDVPVFADESIMSKKAHGTSEKPVQDNLRWGVDKNLADKISNFNRHFAENAGYFSSPTFLEFLKQHQTDEPITFYDSVTGLQLFKAPIGRSVDDFLSESLDHGWPSFRDNEVVWENVRVLKNGETVSLTGTHLGHNLPDRKGNRYCINLVSIAGNPE